MSKMEKFTGEKDSVVGEKRKLFQQVGYYLSAGGMGTRLEPALYKNRDLGITKALIPFGGGTIIDYHLNRATKLGFGQIIIGAGHHRNLADYISKKVSIGVETYEVDINEKQFGTGGDLIRAIRKKSDRTPFVMVQNVDTLLDVPEEEVIRQHIKSRALVTIVLTRKKEVPNEGAYWCDEQGHVIYNAEAAPAFRTIQPETAFFRGSSTGTMLVNTELLKDFEWDEEQGSLSLYRDMLGKWAKEGIVYAYDNGRRFFKDVGIPKTYNQIQRHPIIEALLTKKISSKD